MGTQSRSGFDEFLKRKVSTKANELIESYLKPHYIKPPPENPQFGYIIDIYGKWVHQYFYFISVYRNPRPDAIEPTYEVRFTRMQHIHRDYFSLAYMRYTGRWQKIPGYTHLSLDQCIEAIKNEPWFQP
jgi:hypothetical protein